MSRLNFLFGRSKINLGLSFRVTVLNIKGGLYLLFFILELDDDFILRLDPATGVVIGMTVISFSSHFPFLRSQIPEDGEVETNAVVKALLAA